MLYFEFEFSQGPSCRHYSTCSHFHAHVQKPLRQSVMPERFIGVFSPSIYKWQVPRDWYNEKPQQPPRLKKALNRIMSYLKPQELKSIKEDISNQPDISRTSIQLTSLPAEFFLLIISHLDIMNQVCLQITCRFFRAFIIVDRVALEYDRCRNWANTCFLEKDMDIHPAKVACAFCKTVRPTKLFQIFNHDVGLWQSLRHPNAFGDRGMMNAVPVNRYCRQHRKDFFTQDYSFITSTGALMKKERNLSPRWNKIQIFRCWHCACVVRFNDKREAGCLNCLCDFCPRLKSKHYIRAGFCLPGQGLYVWDGQEDIKLDKSYGKERTHVVLESGGQIVLVPPFLDDRIWYVG